MTEPAEQPRATIVGTNPIPIWGLSNAERTRRLALASCLDWAGPDATDARVFVNAAFVFDPAWFRFLAASPGTVLTVHGVPVMGYARDGQDAAGLLHAMHANAALDVREGMTVLAYEDAPTIENKQLRKRETPFVGRLQADSVRGLERQSYFGAYKGVTDILTKYLWPEWALVLTRVAARIGMTPNQVTAIGAALCVIATVLFWFGHFWWGMAAGLVFMVLDTVDGKLARCTITSSWWGNIFDHGIDLVHPPFWWWAWGVGLAHWGLALEPAQFAWVMIAIVGGYVVQRLIEGVFMRRNGMMHIHVWERVDSRFRLITARRNPNMVILFVATALQRPDIGLVAVAWWTLLSCLFHFVRLVQAEFHRARGGTITSWMAEPT